MCNIFPIPKKKYASDIKKYRPFFLLCDISKVLESIYIWGKNSPSYSHLLAVFTNSQSRIFQIPTLLANIYNSTDNKLDSDVF